MAETTLSLPPARPGRPPAATPAAEPPAERARYRLWVPAFWAVVLIAFLAKSPGKTTFETKLGVATDPWGFIGDLGSLWHDRAGFGGLADQYIGYAFPILPYYALADLVRLPVWAAERLWLSLIVTAAFWGALRLAEALRIGTARSRLLGAATYALWPTFTIVIGSTSAGVLPGAALPWVLLPLLSDRSSPRRTAARSAVLIPFMGGVNAASTLAALLPVGLYLLSRPAGPRKWRLIAWWVLGVSLATAWWVIPLILLGVYGENFLPYVEQADTTTTTMSATELLRGAGNWVAYLDFGEPWLPAGRTVVAAVVTIVCSAFAAALGLAGLARRDLPERRWLTLTVSVVAAIALAGYAGSFGAPFHGTIRDWLDGPIRPFRNIYKFQPGLALALVLGLAHLVGTTSGATRGTTPPARHGPRSGRPYVPLIAAVLVLPGLAWPYLNGTILQPGAFEELPRHWHQTADWLKHNSADSRALVVPATAHGLYTWGSPIDDPLDPLADSPWAQRDFVPFGTPGQRRATDAIEQALLTGGEVPGLRDFLIRAGLYNVVVRNDLDPDQIGYVPPSVVERTLVASGYHRVTAFGPRITDGRIPENTPIQVQGLFGRRQAVEIWAPPADTPRPGRVGARAVADTAILSGGSEALLQLSADPGMRDRPTVLTGDDHPGIDRPGVQVVADGLRRADTRFGLVNNNTSYTYTATERNPSGSAQAAGDEPKQILPTTGVEHQTTAVFAGAKAVSASSSGNWLFHLPQFDPVNAFDGDPNTAWTEGSADGPVGQWLRVAFTGPIDLPDTLRLTPLAGDATRAAPTRVRVETERGSRESSMQPDGTAQDVRAPAGRATWLRITILGAQSPRSGLSGAGFAEVSVPGVQVSRVLRLPTDAAGADASTRVYSLHRDGDPGGLSPVNAENGLHRRFDTAADDTFTVDARAVGVTGAELDRIVQNAVPGRPPGITVTAESTGHTGSRLDARNLVDGDLTTAWVAGDRPVLHLKWEQPRSVDQIVLGAAGGLSARPERIEISTPFGSATASVDENGTARFPAIRTDRLTITISKVAPLTLHNPLAGRRLQLPVGLSEVYIPAVADLRQRPADPGQTFRLPCGQGPTLTVDNVPHPTSVSGTVRDLTERRSVRVRLCDGDAPGATLSLPRGTHTVTADDRGPVEITDVTLVSEQLPSTDRQSARVATAVDWSGDHRTVRVGAGEATYLQMYENRNSGWKATLGGKKLRPVRIDGWQQGWLVPAGAAGTVRLDYEPGGIYRGALIGGAVALAALLALALIRRRGELPAGDAESRVEPPAPGSIQGVVAPTAVIVLIAGPLALLVPAVALVARRRQHLLVPVAFVAMAGAGVAAAIGAGEPVGAGEGAFGPAAQILALIALIAALVTVGGADRDGAGDGDRQAGGSDGEGAAHHDSGEGYGSFGLFAPPERVPAEPPSAHGGSVSTTESEAPPPERDTGDDRTRQDPAVDPTHRITGPTPAREDPGGPPDRRADTAAPPTVAADSRRAEPGKGDDAKPRHEKTDPGATHPDQSHAEETDQP
ncbi:alpha-(1-_3)-arabinofuranosyltransferase domain-containing protein [Embleya hyalina]|uniref:Coagulation factor 5/8 type n=1 Tax=Embleya hyalina TaxID=516124 RepID=A0A401YKD2_9ACTN|nr:alpha-(1->3)-arabinofuranosyltransferase family protein [Embleya hyalina]GCD95038.1 coagulation factor 5/8 type [Embleya hyalina]